MSKVHACVPGGARAIWKRAEMNTRFAMSTKIETVTQGEVHIKTQKSVMHMNVKEV